jgi:hypothetical protein
LKATFLAAKKAGAKQVEVRIGQASVVIHLAADDKPVEADEEINL